MQIREAAIRTSDEISANTASTVMLARLSRASQLPRRAAGVPIRLSTQLASAPSTSAVDALNAPLSQTDPELFDIIEHDFLARVFTAERHVCILGINIPRMANISAPSR